MFQFAFLIGFFSYILFFIGIFGLFYKFVLIFIAVVYFSAILISFFPQIKNFILSFKFPKFDAFYLFFALIAIQSLINLIGALGPELAFDATWYHLTIPKVFLLSHRIFSIPYDSLYYSNTPILGEMLYAAALSLGSEIIAKIIHFSFGILILISVYLFGKRFFNKKIGIIAALILSTNLVFNWESITAYTDLIRTFFEFLAFWALFDWQKLKQTKFLYMSALLLGFAICTKVLSLSSLIIYIPLIFYLKLKDNKKWTSIARPAAVFTILSFLIPSPWFIKAYLYTGNPFFPFFSSTYPIGLSISLFNPIIFLKDVWNLFTSAADPISPVYLAVLPLAVIMFKKLKEVRVLLLYCIIAIFVWYFTPQTGGGRFFLPFLPVFSLAGAFIIEYSPNKLIKSTLIIFVLIVSLISIGYRGLANAKYIPVVLGKESKANFLAKNLNFSFGDFYDTDGFFKKNIKPTDSVLLLGFHNLYYVNFPFTLNLGDRYNYIAVQNGKLPQNFSNWKKVYNNKTTKVSLYAKN